MVAKDYEREIDEFISSVTKMSLLIEGLSSKQEQAQMEGKKAVFVIKGIKKRYILEVTGTRIEVTDDLSSVDTLCYANSAEKFLTYLDRLFEQGDVSCFERAIQRGDFVMKGKHSLHDRIMWKKAFDRLAEVRKVYSQ